MIHTRECLRKMVSCPFLRQPNRLACARAPADESGTHVASCCNGTMEATQNIAVPHAPARTSSSGTKRKIQATPRERKRIGAFGGALVLVSLLIWIWPHALDNVALVELLWSRPLALGYLVFGAVVLYSAVANVRFREEPTNPFAARH